MKKIILSAIIGLWAAQSMAHSGISLNEDVSFSGKCGKLSVGGKIMGHIGTYFVPIDVSVMHGGKAIFRSDDDDRYMSAEHMSVNCLGTDEAPKLVVGLNCVAHAPVCGGKTWFYIFDGNTGAMLAPKDVKTEKGLCNAKCADKVLGTGKTVQIIDQERYK
jgi:hypothetical protein